MKPAFFQRLPWWLWLGWLVHLVAYTLPSYRVGDEEAVYGWKCAHMAYQTWFSAEGFLSELRKGEMDVARSEAIMGWFNVTNLAAILAPWLLLRFRRPMVVWWVALLCMTGAAQALALECGLITGRSEFPSLRIGFYVWMVSYVWLAAAAFTVWRRIRPPAIGVMASGVGGL